MPAPGRGRLPVTVLPWPAGIRAADCLWVAIFGLLLALAWHAPAWLEAAWLALLCSLALAVRLVQESRHLDAILERELGPAPTATPERAPGAQDR